MHNNALTDSYASLELSQIMGSSNAEACINWSKAVSRGSRHGGPVDRPDHGQFA